MTVKIYKRLQYGAAYIEINALDRQAVVGAFGAQGMVHHGFAGLPMPLKVAKEWVAGWPDGARKLALGEIHRAAGGRWAYPKEAA